jgi:hypothetical protein
MQRHRNQRIGVGEQVAAGPCHPSSHGRREVEPVAVFQGMDELARDLVVAHCGAGPVIRGRIGNGLHRQQAWPGVEGERNAKTLAIGRRDERELGPADRAQAGALDGLATARAQLRQRDVDDEPEARPH